MILGDLIKKYRKDHHMSMDQFSKKSGISKAYISILERNCNPVNGKPVVPSLETIKAVSSVIGIDFNEVISMLDGNQPVVLTSSNEYENLSKFVVYTNDEQVDKLVKIYTRLPPEHQKMILDYVISVAMTEGIIKPPLSQKSFDSKVVEENQ